MHALCILPIGAAVPQTLTIRNVPDSLARKLKTRAERNHRSLQGEVMAILEQASVANTAEQTDSALSGIRDRKRVEDRNRPERRPSLPMATVEKKLTIEEIWERGKRLGLSSPNESARIVRKLRDERYSR